MSSFKVTLSMAHKIKYVKLILSSINLAHFENQIQREVRKF